MNVVEKVFENILHATDEEISEAAAELLKISERTAQMDGPLSLLHWRLSLALENYLEARRS